MTSLDCLYIADVYDVKSTRSLHTFLIGSKGEIIIKRRSGTADSAPTLPSLASFSPFTSPPFHSAFCTEPKAKTCLYCILFLCINCWNCTISFNDAVEKSICSIFVRSMIFSSLRRCVRILHCKSSDRDLLSTRLGSLSAIHPGFSLMVVCYYHCRKFHEGDILTVTIYPPISNRRWYVSLSHIESRTLNTSNQLAPCFAPLNPSINFLFRTSSIYS
jgi:hypothetical protein